MYYIVYPLETEQYEPKGFEDLYEAILWQDELSMLGIKSNIDRLDTYIAA